MKTIAHWKKFVPHFDIADFPALAARADEILQEVDLPRPLKNLIPDLRILLDFVCDVDMAVETSRGKREKPLG